MSVKPVQFGSTQMQQLVRGEVQQFIAQQKTQSCDAPMNPDRFESIDVTPNFDIGERYRAYNINGELLLRQQTTREKGAPESWFDLGPMPFAVPEDTAG